LLLEQDEEEAVEGLALVEVGEIGDIDVFHKDDHGRRERSKRLREPLPCGSRISLLPACLSYGWAHKEIEESTREVQKTFTQKVGAWAKRQGILYRKSAF
jgi:hypothetical protein